MTDRLSRRNTSDNRAHDLIFIGDEDGDAALAALEAALAIDLRRVRENLAAQPDKFYRAALREARVRAEHDKAERQLTLTEARVLDDLRSSASRRDDPPADALLVARARVHADVEAARRTVSVSRRRLWLAESLRRAYELRHEALIALVSQQLQR